MRRYVSVSVFVWQLLLLLLLVSVLVLRTSAQFSSSSSSSAVVCLSGPNLGVVPGQLSSFEYPSVGTSFYYNHNGVLAGAWPTTCLPWNLSSNVGIAYAGGGVWDPQPGSARSPDGSAQYVIMQVTNGSPNPALLSTTILSLTVGQLYYVNFAWAPRGSFATSPYYSPESVAVLVNGVAVFDLTDVTDLGGWAMANSSAFTATSTSATLVFQVTSADPTHDWSIVVDAITVVAGTPTLPTPILAVVGTIYGFEQPRLASSAASAYAWLAPLAGLSPVVNSTFANPFTFGYTSGISGVTSPTFAGPFTAAAEGSQFAFLETSPGNSTYSSIDASPTISLSFQASSASALYSISFQYSTRLLLNSAAPNNSLTLTANGALLTSLSNVQVSSGWIAVTTSTFSVSSLPPNTYTSAANVIRLVFKVTAYDSIDHAVLLDAVSINNGATQAPVSSSSSSSTGGSGGGGGAGGSSTGAAPSCVIVPGAAAAIVPGVVQSFEYPSVGTSFYKYTAGPLNGTWPTNCLPWSFTVDAGIAYAGGGVWDPRPGSVQSPDGSAQYAILQVAGVATNPAMINSTISSLVVGQSYYINFAYAPRGSFAANPYFTAESLSVLVNGVALFDLTDVSDLSGWQMANSSAFTATATSASIAIVVTSADPTNDWTILVDAIKVVAGTPTLSTPVLAPVGPIFGFEQPIQTSWSYAWQSPLAGTWPVVNASFLNPFSFSSTSGTGHTGSIFDNPSNNAAEGSQYAFLQTSKDNSVYNTTDWSPTIALSFQAASAAAMYSVSFQYSTRFSTGTSEYNSFQLLANGQQIWSTTNVTVSVGWVSVTTPIFAVSSVPANVFTSASNVVRLLFKVTAYDSIDHAVLLDAVSINNGATQAPVSSSSSTGGSSNACPTSPANVVAIVPGVTQSFEYPSVGTTFYYGRQGPLINAWPTPCLPWSFSVDAGIAYAGGGVWDPRPGSVKSPDGSAQYVILQVAGVSSNPAMINSTISSLVVGQSYYVNFAWAPRGSFAANPYFNPESLSVLVNGVALFDLTDVSDVGGWQMANSSAFTATATTATIAFQVTSADPVNDWAVLVDAVTVVAGVPTLPTPVLATAGATYGFEQPALPAGNFSYAWLPPLAGTWPVVNATLVNPFTFGYTSGIAAVGSAFDGQFSAAPEGANYAFLETARNGRTFNTLDAQPSIALSFQAASTTSQYTVSFQYSSRLSAANPSNVLQVLANGQQVWSLANLSVTSGWMAATTSTFSVSSVPANMYTSASLVIRVVFKLTGYDSVDRAALLDAVVINGPGVPVPTGRSSSSSSTAAPSPSGGLPGSSTGSATVATSNSSSSGLSGGAIAGIVIGALVGAVLCLLLAVCLMRSRGRLSKKYSGDEMTGAGSYNPHSAAAEESQLDGEVEMAETGTSAE